MYKWLTTNLSQVTDKLYHIMFIEYTSPWVGFKLKTLVVIGTDCTGRCKFNYHNITTTTAPQIESVNNRYWYRCQWLATGWWFSLGSPVSSTNKTDCHDITEILLNVALSTITPPSVLLKTIRIRLQNIKKLHIITCIND
jgi:hypothetical protein